LLTWEHIDFQLKQGDNSSGDPDQSEEARIDAHLLGKFDKYMQEQEDQNKKLHEQISQLKMT